MQKKEFIKISFNRPFTVGTEFNYIQQAINNACLSGNGTFTKQCQNWLKQKIGCCKALLTHSGTAALEITAILANIQPGDEIIMPSYIALPTWVYTNFNPRFLKTVLKTMVSI